MSFMLLTCMSSILWNTTVQDGRQTILCSVNYQNEHLIICSSFFLMYDLIIVFFENKILKINKKLVVVRCMMYDM